MHSGLDEDGRPKEHAGLGKPATLRQCHEVIEAQALQITQLLDQMALLQERLKLDSRNSSNPASSDGPAVGNRAQRRASTRKRGAQVGHKRSFRAPLDESHCPREGSANWLWGVVQPSLVVYSILPSWARYVVHDLIGQMPKAVVVSDRYAGYAHIDPSRRQVCWAHLLRDFARIARRQARDFMGYLHGAVIARIDKTPPLNLLPALVLSG